MPHEIIQITHYVLVLHIFYVQLSGNENEDNNLALPNDCLIRVG